MAKFKSKGLSALIGASNPPTTAILQLGDGNIDLGEREGLIDVTTHDNSTGVTEQLDNGFKTPMSFSGEILYDPADSVHEVIRAALDAGTALYIKLVLPDTGAATFIAACRVKSFGVAVPVKGKLSAQLSVEGMGATTFTA